MPSPHAQPPSSIAFAGWCLITFGALMMLVGVLLNLDATVSYLGLGGVVSVAAGLQLKAIARSTSPGEGPTDVV